MELKFRVYSRSASKKRWNEKWKLKLVSGEEFHVTNQLLKIPPSDEVAPSDIVCVFYIQDGSLYFQMRDDHRTSIINGVARPDAVVGKGDRIAIDEYAEILILQAPQASVDGPTLTDVGALEEGDGPTLAMEASAGEAVSGISADDPIEQAPGVVGGAADEIPLMPEPTTFTKAPSFSEEVTDSGQSLGDDESIPDIAADDRPEMTKAGLRSLLEATKTSAKVTGDDLDKTPPMGIQRPEDLPFESVLDPLHAVSDAQNELRREATRVGAMKAKAAAAEVKKSKAKLAPSFAAPGDEHIELEPSTFTDTGIDKEVTGVYHSPPGIDSSKLESSEKNRTKKRSRDGENEITKSIQRIREKTADLTGALTKRLRNFSNTLTGTKTEMAETNEASRPPKKPRKSERRPEPIDLTGTATRIESDSLGTPPSIEPASFTDTKSKPKAKIKLDTDDVTGDGIVVQKPRPHPAQLAQEDEARKVTKSRSTGRAAFFGFGLLLSGIAFFLVYVLLKPTERTPIQSLHSNPSGDKTVVVNGGGATGQPGTIPGQAVKPPPQLPPGHAQAVVMTNAGIGQPQGSIRPNPQASPNPKAQPTVKSASAPGNPPPPVFKNPANPTAPSGGIATASDPSFPRGIPIEVLIKKVQRLKETPSSTSSTTPGSPRTIQGSFK